MRTTGIISEYNPFHNGHLHQLKMTRALGTTHVVSVMSGNFVQRGEIAIIDKHKRAELAIKSGVDLVIELPIPYSIASAELFSKGAIHILNSLGVVDYLSFGSESGDIELLKKSALSSIEISNSIEFKEIISTGISYPSAFSKIAEKSFDKEISTIFHTPNNMLAIEYIKAILQLNSKIMPITIKREQVAHDSEITSESIASASFIRNLIETKRLSEISQFVPKICSDIIINSSLNDEIAQMKSLEKIILYKLSSITKSEMEMLPDATNGLADRIFNASRQAKSIKELYDYIKTKCYTMARIRRVILYALLGIKTSDFENLPPYARILAMNENGCEILSKAKKVTAIPFSTSLFELSKYNDVSKRFAELDCLSSDIFSLATNNLIKRQNEYSVQIKKII